MLADDQPCYFVPSSVAVTTFDIPPDPYDYLYVDRSALLGADAASQITAYLDVSPQTKLIVYVKDLDNPHLASLLPRAALVFAENHQKTADFAELSSALASYHVDLSIIIHISDRLLSLGNISEPIARSRIDTFTHLSIYSIASATILGCFILGKSVEESLLLARTNLEHAKLNSALALSELESLAASHVPSNELESIAKSLLVPGKGILAADESGGSIHKKFDQLSIPDTYDTRRDYRNIFFTTPHLSDHASGVILFDETARQTADDGQSFTDYLIARRIIPGIKVDQGLTPLRPGSLETITQGLDGLGTRLAEYYQMGLRFAKWRAAFEIRLGDDGHILTPTDEAIAANCRALAAYAKECQQAGLVPIVEPEVVYDGYYRIEDSINITGRILDRLFQTLIEAGVDLHACILKCNMVLAGKQYEHQSTPEEIGQATADTLKAHVPKDLAGVVFLSGGQTPEQATANLASIVKHGPFPWPVTFSFARALQDPALFAWAGDNTKTTAAQSAFLERLKANTDALKRAE
ncbi:fructose-bisphosphate aldolase class I [Candidatus Saccharibacteria bacterium]|nr:fructose-bisphosphate aldolase class I [Candidatus Saccharibacteria bacterium]